MKALITGVGGLVGSAAARKLLERDNEVFGIENNMRGVFFGEEGSVISSLHKLMDDYPDKFGNLGSDIRDKWQMDYLVKIIQPDLIIHTAAQPSHDWAATDPQTDFFVNAVGTLNLLEAARNHCPNSPFCHISTSKVYGDTPNYLPLEADEWRLDLSEDHEYYDGITTSMSIDHCLHSLFGVSKASGDLLVQEYGRYFGMPTISLRPGCVTGSNHSSVELHGFLSYLVKCVVQERQYTVYGYEGKQVRCNIHADDLVEACLIFAENPKKCGEAYNIGGGRESACSMLEAIWYAEHISANTLAWEYDKKARIGDHRWWISDISEFQHDYPDWEPKWKYTEIIEDIYEAL